MLFLFVLMSLPHCPQGVTAQPLPAEARYGFVLKKPLVGRAPSTPCIDRDGHLAIPRIVFEVGEYKRLRPESTPILDRIADWLHATPNAGLRVHSVHWIGWIRGAQPYLLRARTIVEHLTKRGIARERLSVMGTDVLIPDDAPDAHARRRVMTGFWFERQPYTPKAISDCTAVCAELGLCALKDGRCIATDAGCRAAGKCRREGLCARAGDVCALGSDADCRRSTICDVVGACRAVDTRCQAVDPTDCKGALVCLKNACTVRKGICNPGGGGRPDCARSDHCMTHGRCGNDDGICRPTESEHCRRSSDCSDRGWCALDGGRCRARTASHCRYSYGCKSRGECTLRDGWCVARRDVDCRASVACGVHGLCSLVAYNCGAKTTADCAQSLVCKLHKRCRVSPRGDCQK